MNRVELMQKLHDRTGIESDRCIRIIDALFGSPDEPGMIEDELALPDGRVTIPGFGSFYRVAVGARSGVAPDGTPWTLGAHHRPAFRPAAALKARVGV